jgi:CubicO group peptidase (beta-lactamase class C family)
MRYLLILVYLNIQIYAFAIDGTELVDKTINKLIWQKFSSGKDIGMVENLKTNLIVSPEDKICYESLKTQIYSNKDLKNICVNIDSYNPYLSYIPNLDLVNYIKEISKIELLSKLVKNNILEIGANSYMTSVSVDKPYYSSYSKNQKAFFSNLKDLQKFKVYKNLEEVDGDGFLVKLDKETGNYVLDDFYVLDFGNGHVAKFSFDATNARAKLKQMLKEEKLDLEELINKTIVETKLKSHKESIVPQKVLSSVNDAIPVLLKNDNSVIPISHLESNRVAFLSISKSDEFKSLKEYLQKYTKIDCYSVTPKSDKYDVEMYEEKLKTYDIVLIAESDNLLKDNLPKLKSALYNSILLKFGDISKQDIFNNSAVVYSPSKENTYQEIVAQIVFGAKSSKGVLANEISEKYPSGYGLESRTIQRLSYGVPEEVGMDSEYLSHIIDSVAEKSIKKHAFPGCQVLVAKDGKVIFHKAYGYHTYYPTEPAKLTDVFDLASVTKVAAATVAVMKMVDEKKMNLDSKFSEYWSDFNGTNKENLVLREILAHQAGLIPYIQFWKETVDDYGNFKNFTFEYQKSWFHEIEVARNMYLWNGYREDFYDKIAETDLLKKKKYKYSGLSFILYPEIIKDLTEKSFDNFLYDTFYKPLGAYTTLFNPHNKLELKDIVPTENDEFFRHTVLRGYVHDEGSAMLGGVSGNAGLFSNANDLAKLMQMLLNKGYYGGQRFLSEEVVNEFTKIQYPDNDNRRGLGFDKPLMGNDTLSIKDAYPAPSVSPESFGHSGYTGTFTWVDPKSNIVYIFFSNRVHPTRDNPMIYRLNTRISIHQAIYDAIDKYKLKYEIQN